MSVKKKLNKDVLNEVAVRNSACQVFYVRIEEKLNSTSTASTTRVTTW